MLSGTKNPRTGQRAGWGVREKRSRSGGELLLWLGLWLGLPVEMTILVSAAACLLIAMVGWLAGWL